MLPLSKARREKDLCRLAATSVDISCRLIVYMLVNHFASSMHKADNAICRLIVGSQGVPRHSLRSLRGMTGAIH